MSRAAVGVPLDVEVLTGAQQPPPAEGSEGSGGGGLPVGGQRCVSPTSALPPTCAVSPLPTPSLPHPTPSLLKLLLAHWQL